MERALLAEKNITIKAEKKATRRDNAQTEKYKVDLERCEIHLEKAVKDRKKATELMKKALMRANMAEKDLVSKI